MFPSPYGVFSILTQICETAKEKQTIGFRLLPEFSLFLREINESHNLHYQVSVSFQSFLYSYGVLKNFTLKFIGFRLLPEFSLFLPD